MAGFGERRPEARWNRVGWIGENEAGEGAGIGGLKHSRSLARRKGPLACIALSLRNKESGHSHVDRVMVIIGQGAIFVKFLNAKKVVPKRRAWGLWRFRVREDACFGRASFSVASQPKGVYPLAERETKGKRWLRGSPFSF